MRSPLGCSPALALAFASALLPGCSRSGSASGSGIGLGSEDGAGADGPSLPYSNPNPGSPTLYVRLGGVDGIRTVVDELVSRIAADPRIQQYFVHTDFRRFKSGLVVHICQVSGGPCRYRGRSMTRVHRGLRVRSPHFEAFMEDARGALKAAQIGERERYELLSILRSLKPQVVETAR
jgi:hemoglobin